MGFTQAISSVFSKYAEFSGRALRSEYWYFMLFCIIADIILSNVDAAINGMSWAQFQNSGKIGVLGLAFSLGVLIPSISVAARRLHDVGRSGWWMLITLTIIGIIPFLYWTIIEGDLQENAFGEPAINR